MIAAVVAAESAERRIAVFGALHLAILSFTIAFPWCLALVIRRRERFARPLAGGLAALLMSDRIFAVAAGNHYGRIAHWAEALPMHLCDWASIAVIVALVTRSQLAYELSYFWGLAGTVQALLTPDIAADTPMPLAISFFVSHCGIVIGVLYMTWGLGRRPLRGSVWRALGWNQVYLLAAGLSNWAAHTNFGYLAAKPIHASLMDFFAPWPWYILELEVVALLFFLFFYAPYWRRNSSGSETGALHV